MYQDRDLELLADYFPFLLIDKIIKKTKEKSIEVIKNVSGSEIYFQGHFPNEPIMPGVLICELMIQAGHVLLGFENPVKKIFKVESYRILKIVRPGDTISCVVEQKTKENDFIMLKATVTLDQQTVASAKIYYRLLH